MSKDYLPRPDAEFDRFFTNFYNYVKKKCGGPPTLWTHISADDLDELETVYEGWRITYDRTLVPHAPTVTQEKNRVRVVTERWLRTFINRWIRWGAPVTNMQRDEIGVPNEKTSRTNRPRPNTPPVLESEVSIARRITLHFRDKGAERRGKPDNVEFIEIRWVIQDEMPKSLEEFTHTETDSASPHVIDFTECERGKRFWATARWMNGKTEEGPWAEEYTTLIIP